MVSWCMSTMCAAKRSVQRRQQPAALDPLRPSAREGTMREYRGSCNAIGGTHSIVVSGPCRMASHGQEKQDRGAAR